ncbi:MAG: ABC transporter permease, partial [Candidatus Nanopelagicales bacterium]
MTVTTKSRRVKTVYLLLIPGFAWLFFFFFFPLGSLLATSLKRPLGDSPEDGFAFALQFSNYSLAIAEYWPYFVRAFIFAAIATFFCLLLAYPISYYMAFKATKYWDNSLVIITA